MPPSTPSKCSYTAFAWALAEIAVLTACEATVEKSLLKNPTQKLIDFVADFRMPLVLLVIAINAVMADLEGYFDE